MPSIHPKVHLPMPYQGIQSVGDDFHLPPDALRSTSYNWMMHEGKIVTRPGLAPFGQISSIFPPVGIISYHATTDIGRLVHATTKQWWSYNTSLNLWVDISQAPLYWSEVSRHPVVFRVFNTGGVSWLLGVNGVDENLAWDSDPTHAFVLMSASAPIARCMCVVADRVLLGNLPGTLGGSSTIDVSAFQDHTTGWGTVQTAILVETPGYIASMNELGFNQAAIYKTEAVYLATGTTGLAPIRFDLHTDRIPGPASTASVIPITSSLHAIFTRYGELYLFDGATYTRHPSSSRVRLLFEQNASEDGEVQEQSHGYYNSKEEELVWFYVRDGNETLAGAQDAIVVKLNNGSVWKLDFGHLTYGFRASHYGQLITPSDDKRELTFLGPTTGQFYTFDGLDDDGEPIPAFLETGLSDLGDSTRIKTLEEAEHYFANPAQDETPEISILMSESGKAPVASAPQAVTLTTDSTGPYVTGHRTTAGEKVSAKFMGMRIEESTLSAPLEYRGSALTVIPRGHR